MATSVPSEDSAWGRTLSSLSMFVNGGLPHVKSFFEGSRKLLHHASHGFQNLVSSLKGACTTPGSSATQGVPAPRSPSVLVQPVTETAQAPTSTNSNNPPTSESSARAPEGASQIAIGGENGLLKAIRSCRKRTGLCVTILVVGFLSLVLIVVPGLALGLATGQLPWGIALSGTIVTVCGFYGGPVYTIISAGETEDSRGEEAGEEMV